MSGSSSEQSLGPDLAEGIDATSITAEGVHPGQRVGIHALTPVGDRQDNAQTSQALLPEASLTPFSICETRGSHVPPTRMP